MASCLRMYPSLLIIIIVTFVATEEVKDNITCTFTNGKDCSHLLNLNDTKDYIIEKEEINRTGVKIIFDSEQGVEFLHIKSGEALENRVRVLNITRGSLNHLVNLSCSEELQVDKVKLEPVIVSKELQIDFVKGCGNDSDPIIIKGIYYAVGTDGDLIPQETTQNPLKEEAQTDEVYIPTVLSDTELLSTTSDHMVKMEEFEESTVKTTNLMAKTTSLKTKTMKPILTTLLAKRPTEKSMKETERKIADANKINISASKSSSWKVSHDFACLFLALLIYRNA